MLPKNSRQVPVFVGLVKYYRDMWARRSYLLQPLTALTSTNIEFKWTYVKQKEFDKIKQIVARDTLLIYPDFNERFEIHTDTSRFQLVEAISYNSKPIAFYIHKLTGAQSRYTVPEKELLGIVKNLKEFCTNLFQILKNILTITFLHTKTSTLIGCYGGD